MTLQSPHKVGLVFFTSPLAVLGGPQATATGSAWVGWEKQLKPILTGNTTISRATPPVCETLAHQAGPNLALGPCGIRYLITDLAVGCESGTLKRERR